ncbi:hypothetical protein GCM10017786_45300 [Amycolatopsis deserti]|uniref:DUF4190 domain-containing protein n=1 Tax=Amycolatopsis deserti TaxID=185696 RepID=A0ABQ3J9L4_9PSEU|nr:hypothetical protein [Amycolatopsis deserti]GHF06668.1 hypothetical protein GCM10017786_45300 [Amycolatopsis deserti]
MTEDRRPGVAFVGFAFTAALLIALVAAMSQDLVAGWHGGEYAELFLGIALGAVLAGIVLRLARPPWKSLGTGLVLGGTFGLAAALAIGVMLLVAFSQWSS